MSSDPGYDALELAQRLADYRRSFMAIGEAFITAAGRLDSLINSRTDVTTQLERALVEREAMIDLLAADTALIAFVALEAGKSGRTARDILEHHFEAAPTNEAWRTLLDRNAGDPT